MRDRLTAEEACAFLGEDMIVLRRYATTRFLQRVWQGGIAYFLLAELEEVKKRFVTQRVALSMLDCKIHELKTWVTAGALRVFMASGRRHYYKDEVASLARFLEEYLSFSEAERLYGVDVGRLSRAAESGVFKDVRIGGRRFVRHADAEMLSGFSLSEAAEQLKISPQNLDRLFREGYIQANRVGQGYKRFTPDQIKQFLSLYGKNPMYLRMLRAKKGA